jgi:predicted permease
LFVAPLVAFGLASLFNLGMLTRQAAVLEASMPYAVVNTLIATEFGRRTAVSYRHGSPVYLDQPD